MAEALGTGPCLIAQQRSTGHFVFVGRAHELVHGRSTLTTWRRDQGDRLELDSDCFEASSLRTGGWSTAWYSSAVVCSESVKCLALWSLYGQGPLRMERVYDGLPDKNL